MFNNGLTRGWYDERSNNVVKEKITSYHNHSNVLFLLVFEIKLSPEGGKPAHTRWGSLNFKDYREKYI